MKRFLFNLTRSVLWILASAVILLTLIFGYFQYPVDHEKKISQLETLLPALKNTGIDAFSSDTCEVLIYDGKSFNSEPSSGCGIKAVPIPYLEYVSFDKESYEKYEEVKKIIDKKASQFVILYNENDQIEMARFTSYHLSGPAYYYYVYNPGYDKLPTAYDYSLSGVRVPIDENWYYIDVYN
jgi:hypothetical protein